MTLTINHAVNTLNSAGDNVHAAFLKDCDSGTVKLEKPTTFGLPVEIRVEGWNCDGPDSGGQGYHARIWTHFFWLL